MSTAPYRLLPTNARQRGLAAIGFEMHPPSEVDIEPIDGGETVVRCRERSEGKTVGELEVAVFRAALVIDRDGILEEKVQAAVDRAGDRTARVLPAVAVSLPGASGFRSGVELVRPMGVARPALPYVYVFAMAPLDLAVDGGVLVTVRCASPEWRAADAILGSLRILGRRGVAANDAPDAGDSPLALPLISSDD